jgi:hypothetical protein
MFSLGSMCLNAHQSFSQFETLVAEEQKEGV